MMKPKINLLSFVASFIYLIGIGGMASLPSNFIIRLIILSIGACGYVFIIYVSDEIVPERFGEVKQPKILNQQAGLKNKIKQIIILDKCFLKSRKHIFGRTREEIKGYECAVNFGIKRLESLIE